MKAIKKIKERLDLAEAFITLITGVIGVSISWGPGGKSCDT